jgi:lipoprotein-anchoring transpeptidase ErfK/SrfK
MAIDTREVGGATWYEVSLPARPNGQTGWVRASDVAVTSTSTEIHVYLAEHELDVLVNGAVVMSAPVAVGSDKTPTPLGTFYVTDPLDFTANTTGVYGAYALGLSAYSDVLSTFNGGPPQIAIHGTNEPTLIGQSVSNGCIRMTNATILDLASRVGLGTPVFVSASRDHA